MFKLLLDMPAPDDLESPTEDIEAIADRDKSIFWKLKAQTARLTFRLFSKYSHLQHVPKNDTEERPWIQFFQENYSEMLCESHL